MDNDFNAIVSIFFIAGLMIAYGFSNRISKCSDDVDDRESMRDSVSPDVRDVWRGRLRNRK